MIGEFRKLKQDGKCIHCGNVILGNKDYVYVFLSERSKQYNVTLCEKCIKGIYQTMVEAL